MSTSLPIRRLGNLGVALAVTAGALVATSPPAFAFTPAPHTQLPTLQKNNYVGKPVRLITFVQGDGMPGDPTTFASRVLWFGKALVHSNWYTAASAAFQLGPNGTSAGRRVTNMPTADNSMTATILTNKVRGWVHAMGLPRNPSVRTIFAIYLPCVPGTQWGIAKCGVSFHPLLTQQSPDPDFTPGDSMAVIHLPTNQTPEVDKATVAASHEILEAVTDSDQPGWRMHTFTPTFPYDVSPWIYNENQNGNTEIMDMSGGSRITENFVDATHGYAYRYERIFTNASANANHDPFVPASPLGYASVTNSTNGWVRQLSGGPRDHHIVLTAWSTKAVPDWTLSTSVAAWRGGGNSTPTPDKCSASLGRTTVNNGDHVVLTIHYSGLLTARYWCAVEVQSTTAGAPPSDTNNDRFRQWLVGLRLEP